MNEWDSATLFMRYHVILRHQSAMRRGIVALMAPSASDCSAAAACAHTACGPPAVSGAIIPTAQPAGPLHGHRNITTQRDEQHLLLQAGVTLGGDSLGGDAGFRTSHVSVSSLISLPSAPK